MIRKFNVVFATAAGLILGAQSGTVAASSIANTPHNLGSGNNFSKTPSGNTPSNHSNATAEICVFCHTPHGGDNSAAVPIWNRKLGIGGSGTDLQYKRYSSLGTTTFDAAEAPIGSVTIACLSCHDGTQAIDSIMNQPGSGGYRCEGQPGCVIIAVRLGNFVGGDTDGNGKLGDPAKIVQNLSTDLSNDHPVSMQYGGGGVSISDPAPARTNDPDFFVPKSIPSPPTSTLQKLWYIESGSSSLNPNGRDREDVILYTRNELGTLQPFVECGSCHDPHNSENPTFLRISNSGSSVSGPGIPADVLGRTFPLANGGPSALCLTCHNK